MVATRRRRYNEDPECLPIVKRRKTGIQIAKKEESIKVNLLVNVLFSNQNVLYQDHLIESFELDK